MEDVIVKLRRRDKRSQNRFCKISLEAIPVSVGGLILQQPISVVQTMK